MCAFITSADYRVVTASYSSRPFSVAHSTQHHMWVCLKHKGPDRVLLMESAEVGV